MVPLKGVEPYHLLTPQTTNRVWQIDMMELASSGSDSLSPP